MSSIPSTERHQRLNRSDRDVGLPILSQFVIQKTMQRDLCFPADFFPGITKTSHLIFNQDCFLLFYVYIF
ncbi:hypothetical protein HRM2_16120 [Desulforapulum autotrophicum HRM2]|uniref:Uncharacterized protein n=1 Tax=Desulforapulum autotrophicum (strain ATCC 43914 / DSM 3382 / VKM B-1955 / HRM2) TaxID=177437 RepID=C0QAD6_DESAH|nr:hypothetical protein HRM2_16120 [Desulforapulum autotrophicum HRM2]